MQEQIHAKLRYFRSSPRKARLILNLIQGMNVKEAETQLSFLNKKLAAPILQLLRGAINNAETVLKSDTKHLRIVKAVADQGPTLKRWKPRAMGRATPIRKRSTHLTIVLETYGKKD